MTRTTNHEELMCYDTQGGIFDGEISPAEATERVRLANRAWVVKCLPGDVLREYISDNGTYWTDDIVDQAISAYMGEYDSDEDFAQAMAEDMHYNAQNLYWPFNHIDWEQAAKEHMFEHFTIGRHYFRYL